MQSVGLTIAAVFILFGSLCGPAAIFFDQDKEMAMFFFSLLACGLGALVLGKLLLGLRKNNNQEFTTGWWQDSACNFGLWMVSMAIAWLTAICVGYLTQTDAGWPFIGCLAGAISGSFLWPPKQLASDCGTNDGLEGYLDEPDGCPDEATVRAIIDTTEVADLRYLDEGADH